MRASSAGPPISQDLRAIAKRPRDFRLLRFFRVIFTTSFIAAGRPRRQPAGVCGQSSATREDNPVLQRLGGGQCSPARARNSGIALLTHRPAIQRNGGVRNGFVPRSAAYFKDRLGPKSMGNSPKLTQFG